MLISLKSRGLLILLVFFMSLYFILPNFIATKSSLLGHPLNLGLDLKGGAHLVLKVDFHSYIKDKLYVLSNEIRTLLNRKAISYSDIYVEDENLIIKSEAGISFKDVTNNIKGISVEFLKNKVVLHYNSLYLEELLSNVIEESLANINSRLDSLGTKEIVLQKLGKDEILLQVPGVHDTEKIRSILGRTAKLTFHLLDTTDPLMKINSVTTELINDEHGNSYPVLRKVEISGDELVNVSVDFNSLGKPIVRFKLDSESGKRFAKLTQENINRRLAIVLDKKVLTAPVIREPILGGQGDITGDFDLETAKELVVALRAGALPAPLNIVVEQIIGPTLGEESIRYGKMAAFFSVILVSIVMILSYGLFGVFVDIALLLNVLFILSVLTLLQSTLTLPGIVGITLTIGMSVDANVLIFERIKEEILRSDHRIIRSIDRGFRGAMSTILDSNITTLISAAIMFISGNGPVRGFSVTLSVGIMCSMFSSITITKFFIDLCMKFFSPKKILRF